MMAISWAGIWDGNGFLIRLNAIYVAFPGLFWPRLLGKRGWMASKSLATRDRVSWLHGGSLRASLEAALQPQTQSLNLRLAGIPQRWGQLSPASSRSGVIYLMDQRICITSFSQIKYNNLCTFFDDMIEKIKKMFLFNLEVVNVN